MGRRLLTVFVAMFLAFLAPTASMAIDPASMDKALAEIRAESKVKSAAWNDKTMPSLLVGVWDDGSSRDGYASYFCALLASHGIRGGVVRVMDERASHKGEWKELGKAWCPK